MENGFIGLCEEFRVFSTDLRALSRLGLQKTLSTLGLRIVQTVGHPVVSVLPRVSVIYHGLGRIATVG